MSIIVKDTSKLLTKLRSLMSDKSLFNGNLLEAYIIPSSDSHGSEYLCEKDKRRQFISNFTGSSGIYIFYFHLIIIIIFSAAGYVLSCVRLYVESDLVYVRLLVTDKDLIESSILSLSLTERQHVAHMLDYFFDQTYEIS